MAPSKSAFLSGFGDTVGGKAVVSCDPRQSTTPRSQKRMPASCTPPFMQIATPARRTTRHKSATSTREKSAILDESTVCYGTSGRPRSATAFRSGCRSSQQGKHATTPMKPPLSAGLSRPVSQSRCLHSERLRTTSPLPTSYWRDLSVARGTATPHWKSVPSSGVQAKGERSPPTSVGGYGSQPSASKCSTPHVANQLQNNVDVQAWANESGARMVENATAMSPGSKPKCSTIPVDFSETPYKKNVCGHHETEVSCFFTPAAKSSFCWPSPDCCQNLSLERLYNSNEHISGAKHFSIGDQVDGKAQIIPDECSHQLQEVAKSLETAAAALRNVVSPGFNVEGAASLLNGISRSRLLQSPYKEGWCAEDAPSLCTRTKNDTLLFAHDDAPLDRLTRENDALREALGDAVRKLTELEGEKERFISEDVFDLVNSLCRDSTGGAPDCHAKDGPPGDRIKE